MTSRPCPKSQRHQRFQQADAGSVLPGRLGPHRCDLMAAICQLSLINGSKSVLDKTALSGAQFSDRMSCFRHSVNDRFWRIGDFDHGSSPCPLPTPLGHSASPLVGTRGGLPNCRLCYLSKAAGRGAQPQFGSILHNPPIYSEGRPSRWSPKPSSNRPTCLSEHEPKPEPVSSDVTSNAASRI